MSISCLIVASGELEFVGSEVQEISNLLNGAGFRVQVLSEFESKLELYRTLSSSPFEIVWIAAHSTILGFLIGKEVLRPAELGSFLREAKTTSLILNTCNSIGHIKSIQQNSRVDIVATIDPDGVQDSEAWSFALYLARALARSKNLSQAYAETSTLESQYRWFPVIDSHRDLSQMADPNEDLRSKVDNLVRILDGDPKLRYRGLIDTLAEVQKALDGLSKTVKEYIDSSERWKQDTEHRIKQRETAGAPNIRMTTSTIIILFTLWLITVVTILWLATVLRG